MSETDPQTTAPKTGPDPVKKAFEPIFEDQTFREAVRGYVGKVFLIANPQSFEEGGLGPQIKEGWYKARLVGAGKDYLIVATEFSHGSGKKATKEPVRQLIPFDRIKRVSLMKSERLIHL